MTKMIAEDRVVDVAYVDFSNVFDKICKGGVNYKIKARRIGR